MSEARCSNPKCKKEYNVEDTETDDGFCSFECWESVNCLEPIKVKTEWGFDVCLES